MPRLKREVVLPDARARNTMQNSLLEVLETNVDPNQNLGLVKKQCWGKKQSNWSKPHVFFYFITVSDNMGVVKGRSKITCHLPCTKCVQLFRKCCVSSELNTKECQFQSYFFVRSKCATRTLPKSWAHDIGSPQECQGFVSIRTNPPPFQFQV